MIPGVPSINRTDLGEEQLPHYAEEKNGMYQLSLITNACSRTRQSRAADARRYEAR